MFVVRSDIDPLKALSPVAPNVAFVRSELRRISLVHEISLISVVVLVVALAFNIVKPLWQTDKALSRRVDTDGGSGSVFSQSAVPDIEEFPVDGTDKETELVQGGDDAARASENTLRARVLAMPMFSTDKEMALLAEPVDEDWADLVEAVIRDSFIALAPGIDDVQMDIECRTTKCRMIVMHLDLESEVLPAGQTPEERIQWEAVTEEAPNKRFAPILTVIIGQNVGRLNGYSLTTVQEPDTGKPVTVGYVLGRDSVEIDFDPTESFGDILNGRNREASDNLPVG